jgi:uncharacterized protein (DUF2235 family)
MYQPYSTCDSKNRDTSCTIEPSEPHRLAIFFDGTRNTASDNTNVYQVLNVVKEQNAHNLDSLYIEGVGTEWYRIFSGNAFGNGMNQRLKKAYEYIIDTHYDGLEQEIYLFGFSRGAYNARGLAGLLFTAGIPDFSGLSDKERKKLIKKIVNTYTKDKDFETKKAEIMKLDNYVRSNRNARVKFMGLWDTVSATSILPRGQNKLGKLSTKFVDQLCNVDRVAHAVSVDDNRAHRFAPELLTYETLATHCEIDAKDTGKYIEDKVSEVWFFGAHSDVGGGYSSKSISNISLNWMLRELFAVNDSITNTLVEFEVDISSPTHIGEDSIADGMMYQNYNRNIPFYMTTVHPDLSLFKIHSSVLVRLQKEPRTYREFAWVPDEQSKNINFKDCFNVVELPNGKLKDDKRKADYTLEFKKESEATCFQVAEPELIPSF